MWVPLTCPVLDLAPNPGMRPDWESNWRPFGSQAGTQSTEPHQPRHFQVSKTAFSKWYYFDVNKDSSYKFFLQWHQLLCTMSIDELTPYLFTLQLYEAECLWTISYAHCLQRETGAGLPWIYSIRGIGCMHMGTHASVCFWKRTYTCENANNRVLCLYMENEVYV